MSNKSYFEQVGAFLDNELNDEELAKFNEELANNPELVKELNYQKELIAGIKSYRHSELKARLDNVPVGTGFWSGSMVKILSGAVIVAGIGYGVYEFSFTKEPAMDQKTQNTETVDDTPAVLDNKSASEKVQALDTEDDKPIEREEPKESDESGIAAETEKKVPNTKADQITTPVVPVPDSFEMENPAEEDLNLPKKTLGVESDEPIDSKLEIEVITNKRKYSFHYQVIEGRLLLYGDFNDEPYELLEISVNNEMKLFLYFKENYYEIKEDASDITPLTKVTNRSLVSELELLRVKN